MVKKHSHSSRNNIKKVRKRDGTVVDFDITKVELAINKSLQVTQEGDEKTAKEVAQSVLADLKIQAKHHNGDGNFIPTVEYIQDVVEKELIFHKLVKTAKSYILYRERRSELRQQKGVIPEKVKQLVKDSRQYFRDPLGEFIYYRTYSRWIEEENRRETWIETVDRYMDFMKENIGDVLTAKEYEEVREGILKHEAMPSMRLLQFAGPAARRTNVCAYNCSFIAPKKLKDFSEIMYISMCGTGVGYSVESKFIQELPIIKTQTGVVKPTHAVEDNKEGWCDALSLGLETWYAGEDIQFDYSKLRPAGARLKTMGGKSSGPEPLRRLLDFTREKIMGSQGRRLTNLDAHDIICKIGEIVVAGGVRRSAMISLSDLYDEKMRDAKKGQFYLSEPQRSMANNSAVYNYKPTNKEFLEEWLSLVKSGSGERGIFNRSALKDTLPERRLEVLSGFVGDMGTNPCGEIILKSKQFCNLSEIVARAEDTEESLIRKMRLATILGTFQSSLTKFSYLSKDWEKNCKQERLLGVSITGQWDSSLARDPKILERLRKESIKINAKYAKRFNIEQSTAITCVKPSGTLSQMVDCSSGMHPRHAPYYIRRVRISATDSLFKMLRDQGIPYNPEVGQDINEASTFVIDFPVKAPEGSVYKDDISALDQLEHWKIVKTSYTEHNPSVTVSVGEGEWVEVANWVYKNWEIVGGLSFLPRTNHVYQLAPYEEINKKQYEELMKYYENIDFSKLLSYEIHDETEVKKELACVSGVCDIA
ncbi:MAG: ATP cone domain-containing protein [Patescibacteria group bacterium]